MTFHILTIYGNLVYSKCCQHETVIEFALTQCRPYSKTFLITDLKTRSGIGIWSESLSVFKYEPILAGELVYIFLADSAECEIGTQ